MSNYQPNITKVIRQFIEEQGEGSQFDRFEMFKYVNRTVGREVLQETVSRRLRLQRKRGVVVPCVDKRNGLYIIEEIGEPIPEGQLSLFEEAGTDPSPQDSGSIPIETKKHEEKGSNSGNILQLSKTDFHNLVCCLANRATFPPRKCNVDGCTETTCVCHPSRFKDTED